MTVSENPSLLYQTHARIHLDNIRYNIEGIRHAVGPGRKILIAVKANGYGHGAVELSRMAEIIGVDWLGVATVPEGMQLRQAGIKLPILKFSPAFPEEMAAAIENRIPFIHATYGFGEVHDGGMRIDSLMDLANRIRR